MWIVRAFVTLIASLSIVKLIEFGLVERSFEVPIQVMLQWYENILSFLFDWIASLASLTLTYILSWLGFEVSIKPYWKHAFVLISLYSASQARNAWMAGHVVFAGYCAGCGLIAALVTGLAAGAAPQMGQWMNVLLPAAAVIGISIYQFSNTNWVQVRWGDNPEYYWPGMKLNRFHPLFYLLIGMPLSSVALVFAGGDARAETLQVRVSVTLVLIGLLTSYWIFQGAWWAARRESGDEAWWVRSLKEPTAKNGFIFLYAIFGVIFIVSANAGLMFLKQLNIVTY